MLKEIKGKRGSEVVQTLIVIAIMGTLAVLAINAIASKILDKNTKVVDSIDTNITKSVATPTNP